MGIFNKKEAEQPQSKMSCFPQEYIDEIAKSEIVYENNTASVWYDYNQEDDVLMIDGYVIITANGLLYSMEEVPNAQLLKDYYRRFCCIKLNFDVIPDFKNFSDAGGHFRVNDIEVLEDVDFRNECRLFTVMCDLYKKHHNS